MKNGAATPTMLPVRAIFAQTPETEESGIYGPVMRLLTRALAPLTVAASLAVPVVTSTPATAASYPKSGPCYAGSTVTCHFDYATVDFNSKTESGVTDGDTINAQIFQDHGEGVAGKTKIVRFIGINAMEMVVHKKDPAQAVGTCHAKDALMALYNAVRNSDDGTNKNVVRLGSVTNNPTVSGNGTVRLRRNVNVWQNGAWYDIEAQEVGAGLALPDSLPDDYAWNKTYMTLSQQAALSKIGLFNVQSCKVGPDQDSNSNISIWLKWDADGNDAANRNDEWARIRNNGATPLDLSGWHLRDSFNRGTFSQGYQFPNGAVIPAHSEIRLHAGSGSNNAKNYYWGLPDAPWENVYPNVKQHRSDGAYLYDPSGINNSTGYRDGDLRAWMQYPCYVRCTTPLDGKIKIVKVQSSGLPEYVQIKNVSTKTVGLEGYMIWQNPDSYQFAHKDKLAPGKTLRLYMQHGKGGATVVRSWGLKGYQLGTGELVKFMDYRDHVIASKKG